MVSKKQLQCIELMFDGELSQKQISNKLNVHETTISRWKKNGDFREAIQEYVNHQINDTALMALNTLKKLLKAKSELVRYNAAKDILDRAGFAPTNKHELNGATINVEIGEWNDEQTKGSFQ